MKIGIVSNNEFLNKITEDINIKRHLNLIDVDAEILAWEDTNIDYSKFDALILRSVWGYQNNYIEFKKWLCKLQDEKIIIFNDVNMIKNNIRKDLQFKLLDKYEIPHIKTIFQKGKMNLELFDSNYIVKPIISGSGENTYRLTDVEKSNLEKIMFEEDNGLMIQPYEKTISDGEYSIIFIDGVNTHNMIRFPGIFCKKEKPFQIIEVPNNILKLAYKVKNIPEYKDALYMRVDIVNKNNPQIMEVELAEPDLLTRNIESDKPIKVLCKGIVRRLK